MATQQQQQRPLSYNPQSRQATSHNSPAPPQQQARPKSVNPSSINVDAVYGANTSSLSHDAGDFGFDMSRSDTTESLTPVPTKQRTVVGGGGNSGKQKTVVVGGGSGKQKTVVGGGSGDKQQQHQPQQPHPQPPVNRQPAAAAPRPRAWWITRWLFGASSSKKKKQQQQHKKKKQQPRSGPAAAINEDAEEEEEFVAEFDFDAVRAEAQQRHDEEEARRPLQQAPSQRVLGSLRGTLTKKKPAVVETDSLGKALISGTLLKRAKKTGQWNSRHFTLYDSGVLAWLKSDDRTLVTFSLLPREHVTVRDVKFGVRKFMFEVTNSHGNGNGGGEESLLLLSAAGETEKQEWLSELNALVLQQRGAADVAINATPKRKSLAMVQKGTVNHVGRANEEAIILGITNRGQMPTSLKSQQANEQLKLKLNAGAPVTAATAGLTCGECEEHVFKPEEVKLRDYLTLHRHCFTCSTCDKLLTLREFQQVGRRVYCLDHFTELFPQQLAKNTAATTAPPYNKLPQPRPLIKDKKHAVENCFQIITGSGSNGKPLWVSASSRFERDRWVLVLCNAVAVQELKRVVFEAQKVDMMTAVECQMELETFAGRSDCEYSAFMDQMRTKGTTGGKWDRRWFELQPGGKLVVRKSDASQKKPLMVVQLTPTTQILDCFDARLNGPLALT